MSALPTLVAPGLPTRDRSQAAGGFAWWYVDLVDDHGDGMVFIVGLGLPFLPGYASSARAGRAPPAAERPSVCVAHVRGGRLAFWALHERDPRRLEWSPGRAVMGDDHLDVRVEGGRLRLSARLSGALPGSPWSAELDVDGPLRRPSPGEPPEAKHEWTVMTAVARGRATLTAGGESVTLEGRAYVDRNGGDGALDSFGLAWWTWGRLAFPGRERIWYSARDTSGSERSMALTIAANGVTTVEREGVRCEGARYGRWGLARPAAVQVDDGLRVSLPGPIDDSPFYARLRIDAEESGQTGRGFAEVCRTDRIDAAWFRPLVAMTICHDHRPDSMWLPLFGGPQTGRFGRLVGMR